MSLAYKIGLYLGKNFSFFNKKSENLKSTQPLISTNKTHSDFSKSISMDVNEMMEKAKQVMIEKKWDVLLMDAYLTTKHFVAWSVRDDFDESWNVGIKNVKGVKRNIDVSYINEETEFLTGEFNGIYFELGGVTNYSSMPDGDSFITTNLSLFIGDKRVLAVRYTIDRDEAYFFDGYSLLSVEEFHNHQSIDSLLNSIRLGKLEQERKSKERDRLKNEKKYDGKFSF